MELLGDMGHMESGLFYLEIVLLLTQYRCTVCAEGTIGSEIMLDTPMQLLGDEAQVDACFSPFGDSAILDAR